MSRVAFGAATSLETTRIYGHLCQRKDPYFVEFYTGMSGPKYRDWILETIDQLRKRKARPDLERICHMVERRYGLTFLETEHDIEKLVEEEAIIKVDYKGSTSYRNAAKWRRNHFGVPVSTSSHSLLSDKICNAVRQLNKSEFTNGEKGANITDIENSLVSISQESQLLKNHLQIYLQREIHCGRLKKLPNGNFVIAQPRFKQAKMKTAHAKSTAANPIPSKRGRPPTKRKVRAKVKVCCETAIICAFL